MYETHCQWCEEPFTAQRRSARYCSNTCRAREDRHRRRIRRDCQRREARDEPGGDRWCDNYPECKNLIGYWERPDKRFCSNACRQKNYRQLSRPLTPDELLTIITALTEGPPSAEESAAAP
jgi:hypothetical protein